MTRLLAPAFILSILTATTLAAPATKPSAADLHAQAYQLMLDGDFAKAKPLLEQAYQLTPLKERNRALVLNRAILDMTQRTFVMRAIRDLTTYLTKNRGEDELATNILGGALNLAATDPKLKEGGLWQSAFKEWDRRNYVLDHSRPGFRRWGAQWVGDEELKQIRADQDHLKQLVMDQQDAVNRAAERTNALIDQYEAANNQYNAFAPLVGAIQNTMMTPQGAWQAAQTGIIPGAGNLIGALNAGAVTNHTANNAGHVAGVNNSSSSIGVTANTNTNNNGNRPTGTVPVGVLPSGATVGGVAQPGTTVAPPGTISPGTSITSVGTGTYPPGAITPGQPGYNNAWTAYADAVTLLNTLGPEAQAAYKQYTDELTKLHDLQRKVIRPQWPSKFDPIDPNAPDADHPVRSTTQPTTAPAVFKFGSSQDGRAIIPAPKPPAPVAQPIGH